MTFLEKVFMVVAIAAFLMITGVAKSDEKSITPQEFVSNVAEVPSKVGNWLTGEVEKQSISNKSLVRGKNKMALDYV